MVVLFVTLSFFISLVFSIIITPIVYGIGIKYKIIDIPDKRKTHNINIVRLGGVGILFSFILSIVIIFLLTQDTFIFNIKNIHIITIIIGSILFCAIGLLDDIKEVNPYCKLILQIVVSSLIFNLGVGFEAIDLSWINNNLEVIILPKIISYIFSLIIITGMTNAINWLDGLDGLASGISIIISIGLFIILISLNKIGLALIVAAFCGAIIGFLRYNFYPARILMGDCGSYMLGSSLAIISLLGLSNTYYIDNKLTNSIEDINIFPLHLLILLFLIPVVDMLFVIIGRIIDRKSPLYPDRRHLHHKILDSGLTHKNTVIIMFALTQSVVSSSLYLSNVEDRLIYLGISFIISTLSILYCLNVKKNIDRTYKKY